MNTAIWTGFVVVLLISLLFLGPGLWSDRVDYPVVGWVKRLLRGTKEDASPPPDGPKAG